MSNPFSDLPPGGPVSGNPYQPPQFSGPQGYFPRRGLVSHIRIIVILNIVQGVLELVMGGMLCFMTVIFTQLPNNMPQQPNGPEVKMQMAIMMGVFGVFAGGTIVVALLRFWAAIMNYNLKSRTLGIVSLIAGMLTSLTFYCAPTSIGIGVYGLIVLFNQEVAEAFNMRKTASSAEDVLQQFNARPH